MRAGIIVKGRQSGQFWARAFQLENLVERGRAEVMRERTKPDEHCVMPVLVRYPVDERCGFWCAFALFVDSVGVIDAQGAVFFADKEDEEEVRKDAREAGEKIMQSLRTHSVEIRETIPFKGGEN